MKHVVIVESPTKCKSINKYLGNKETLDSICLAITAREHELPGTGERAPDAKVPSDGKKEGKQR